MDNRADLLYPLSECYAQRGLELPAVSRLQEREIPQPYRSLLVHDRDMTPTLEAAFCQEIHLRVMQRWISGNILTRQVLLILDQDGIPVEFGAIRIHLDSFSQPARGEILQGRRPLGAILHHHRVEHHSRPLAFIRVEADALIGEALKSPVTGTTLYGRLNALRSLQQRKIAEIIELLPAMQDRCGQGLSIQSN
jgi:chorismate-pyruvate lyase